MYRKNWKKLTKRWLAGEFEDYPDMARETGIPVSTIEKHGAKHHWQQNGREVATEVETEVRSGIIEAKKDEIMELRKKKVNVGRDLQREVYDWIKKNKPVIRKENFLDALKTGLKLESEGLGIEENREQKPVINQNTIIFNKAVNAVETSSIREAILIKLRKAIGT